MVLYQTLYGIPVIITEQAYETWLQQTWETFPARKKAFDKKVEGYEFSNGIPKEKCFVKLKAGVTAD